MFSLLYGLYQHLTRREEVHILIVGLDRAGKTTLLERLKALLAGGPGPDATRAVPTVGLNIGRAELGGATVVFWDLGGQSGLRGIWEKYYAEAHALVFVVDASDAARFGEAKAALDRALGHRDLVGAPLLVVANKSDAPGAAGAAELKERLGLGRTDTRPLDVAPASALLGDGVGAAAAWVAAAARRGRRAEALRRRALAG
jgi:ADP-ribosylation factor related protein 1